MIDRSAYIGTIYAFCAHEIIAALRIAHTDQPPVTEMVD